MTPYEAGIVYKKTNKSVCVAWIEYLSANFANQGLTPHGVAAIRNEFFEGFHKGRKCKG